MSANGQELERMAGRVVDVLRENWSLINSLLTCELHVSLNKRMAITVMRRALEIMEEKQI